MTNPAGEERAEVASEAVAASTNPSPHSDGVASIASESSVLDAGSVNPRQNNDSVGIPESQATTLHGKSVARNDPQEDSGGDASSVAVCQEGLANKKKNTSTDSSHHGGGPTVEENTADISAGKATKNPEGNPSDSAQVRSPSASASQSPGVNEPRVAQEENSSASRMPEVNAHAQAPGKDFALTSSSSPETSNLLKQGRITQSGQQHQDSDRAMKNPEGIPSDTAQEVRNPSASQSPGVHAPRVAQEENSSASRMPEVNAHAQAQGKDSALSSSSSPETSNLLKQGKITQSGQQDRDSDSNSANANASLKSAESVHDKKKQPGQNGSSSNIAGTGKDAAKANTSAASTVLTSSSENPSTDILVPVSGKTGEKPSVAESTSRNPTSVNRSNIRADSSNSEMSEQSSPVPGQEGSIRTSDVAGDDKDKPAGNDFPVLGTGGSQPTSDATAGCNEEELTETVPVTIPVELDLIVQTLKGSDQCTEEEEQTRDHDVDVFEDNPSGAEELTAQLIEVGNDGAAKKLADLNARTSLDQKMVWHEEKDKLYNHSMWMQYKIPEKVLTYYMRTNCQLRNVRSLDLGWEPYMRTISHLSKVRSDENAFKEMYGKLYKWEYRHIFPVTHDKFIDMKSHSTLLYQNANKNSSMPLNYRLYLKLRRLKSATEIDAKTTEDDWTDWIYLSRSTYAKARIGVFAARQFKAFTPIGHYIGPTIWRADLVGGRDPWDEYLRTQLKDHEQFKDYQMSVRDTDGRCCVVGPKPLFSVADMILGKQNKTEAMPLTENEKLDCTRPLYMGMHYLNDALFDIRRDKKSDAFERRKKEINVYAEEDSTLFAAKRINTGTELCFSYNQMDLKTVGDVLASHGAKSKTKIAPKAAVKKAASGRSRSQKSTRESDLESSDAEPKASKKVVKKNTPSPRKTRRKKRCRDKSQNQREGQKTQERGVCSGEKRRKLSRMERDNQDYLPGGERLSESDSEGGSDDGSSNE